MTIGIEKNEIRSESKRFRRAFSMSMLIQELLFQPRQFKFHRQGGPTFGRHPPRRVARYPDYVVELFLEMEFIYLCQVHFTFKDILEYFSSIALMCFTKKEDK